MTIYLDYNATAPIRPQVIDTVAQHMAVVGNASSIHQSGRDARGMIETARKQVASLVGAQPKQVTFTSGGTESNNIAILGGSYDRILVGAGEHPSVLDVCPDAIIIPTLPTGVIDTDVLGDLLAEFKGKNTLVCVMHANNETGIINPIKDIGLQCVLAGAKLHVDAIQSVGKIPVDFLTMGMHSMSLSAHKIGGPQGVGALIADPAMNLRSVHKGGGQEQGTRSGTENVAGIAGMGMACQLAEQDLQSQKPHHLEQLRNRMESEILSIIGEHITPNPITIVGGNSERTPHTSCLIAERVPATTQLMNLDLAGIMVSSGSACSSGSVKPSHVLMAMGYDADTAGCAIRISLGWQTTDADIDAFLKAYIPLIKRIKGS